MTTTAELRADLEQVGLDVVRTVPELVRMGWDVRVDRRMGPYAADVDVAVVTVTVGEESHLGFALAIQRERLAGRRDVQRHAAAVRRRLGLTR